MALLLGGLLAAGGIDDALGVQSPWHGPSDLIFKQCALIGEFGSTNTTVSECEAHAASVGVNAINFNTDPNTPNVRCQLRNCSHPVAPTWSVPAWRAYSTFAMPPPPPPAPPAPPAPGALSRVLLVEAASKDGAVCLDGSPAAYYWRAGSGSGVNSWVLFLEGSSKSYGPTMNLGEGAAIWSSDPETNPRFWNWNIAYAKYCDGASFSGNRSEPIDANSTLLYFRGARILKAIVANVTGPVSAGGKGLLNADAAILSGCSAGGLATYLHCDAFASLVAPTPTKCVADAGYFANIPSMFGMPPPGHENPRKSIIEYEYTWVFANQQSNNSGIGVNQNCLAALGRDNPLCFFPEYSLKYMTTPMFVLQSGYDSWQTNFIWFTPDGGKPTDPGWHACAQFINQCNASQLAVMDTYHDKFVAKLAPMTDSTTPHGGYVESCMSHCQSGSIMPAYDNHTSLQMIADWYDGKIKAKEIDRPYPTGVCKK